MKIHEIICPHCGYVWQSTLGPKYEAHCWDRATKQGCGGDLPTREQILGKAA